jgi:tetratricopeptide (TPR) repeat protein
MKTTRIAIGVILVLALVLLAAVPQNKTATLGNAQEAARLNNLGCAYMNQQLFEKALKIFQDSARLDPKLATARLNQAIALLNLQRVDEAKKLLLEVTQSNPKDPHAWYNLGLLYKNSGDPQGAVEAFRSVTEIDPNDADGWYMLGTVHVQQKQFPQAIDAFQHALKLNPLHASAEFGLSRAYQQSGDTETARKHLKRFQYITQNKLGATMSLAYGEQGQYSRAEESPGVAEHVPALTKVRFVPTTTEAGVGHKEFAAGVDWASVFGSGACFFDQDGSGRLDLLLADDGPQGGLTLYHNLGNGKFEDVTRKAGLDPTMHAKSCATGDYDNDGATDLALTFADVVVLFHNEKNGTFKDVTEAAGLGKGDPRRADQLSFAVTFIDYDHDGDLDLYVTRYPVQQQFDPLHPDHRTDYRSNDSGSNRMWRNNGDGTFTDVSESVGLSGTSASVAAVGTDYNNDRAVDLLLSGWQEKPILFANPREGKFPVRTPWASSVPNPTVAIAVLDFDHDGWMDVAFTHWAAPGITLWRNNQGKSFEPVKLPATNWIRSWGIAAVDYDNDGWVDLAAVGETKAGKGEIRLFRNLGPQGFKDVTADVGLDRISLKDPRALITGDYDADGATDFLVTQNHGSAVLLRNEGGNQNHWLRLALKGLADNKSAIGTKIEVFAGGNRQKWEIAGSSGYLGQNSPEIIAGLGPAKQADVVRMLWPTGVLQDEIEVAGNRQQNYVEIDRRGSSCPTLFAWDGKHYALVGDMLGAGVVGHWIGPDERNVARPVEYMKLDRNALREKDGKLSFRFMEPLEEAVYLDRVGLLAVDHPGGVDVYPNEYFASNPPYPPFKVVFSRDAKAPAGAWDEHGHNVLPDLLAHKYFGDFHVLSFAGFTQLHSLELDLGEPSSSGPLWLLMHGEIEYFTATGMYAADQAKLQPIAPYVEAQDSNGKWMRVIDDLGFPAGGARMMTADLTGKLPAGTRRIRIWTNLQIYWDNILISRTPQRHQSRVTAVPLGRANLQFHGFPLKIENQPPGNVKYIYEKASATGPYTRPAGAYTRFGDVRSLLTDIDDRMAVFGSGDEVALDFDPRKLPALPKGWVRDYFFFANGYEKDMDFYAFEGSSVAPLPFHSMGIYPYPGKSFPMDDEHLKYLLEFNTRQMSGHEATGYAFQYPEK